MAAHDGATATLQIAQSLYEKHKLLSYPRTESRHLSRDIVAGLPAVIDASRHSFPEAAALAHHKVKRNNSFRIVLKILFELDYNCILGL